MDPNIMGMQVRLEGAENWHTWKFTLKVILKAIGAYGIVDGTQPCPTKENADIVSEWQKLDAKAQSVIITRLSPNVIIQVQNCETAKAIWDKLITVFEQKSDISLHMLQQRFFDMKMQSNESMTSFLARVEDVVSQIKQNEGEISDNMTITRIISSLGEKYRHFVSAWDSVPSEKRTLSELTARLLIEEQRYKSYEDSESNGQMAFKASTLKNIRKCFNCGKAGHYKKDCKLELHKRFCKKCKKQGHTIEECWFNKDKNKNSGKQNAFLTTMSISALTTECKNKENESWFLDSGASEHMSNLKHIFSNYKDFEVSRDVVIGDGSVIKAVGQGDVKLKAYDGDKWIPTTIHNVLHVPDLKVNLFSMSAALDKGYELITTSNESKFIKKGSVHALAKREGKMYIMQVKIEKEEVALVGKSLYGLQDWHEKFAHQDINQVKSILDQEHIVYNKGTEETCIPCVKGKHHRKPFPTSESRSTKPGEIIHIDIGGPVEEISLGGAKYFLLLKDDYTKYRKVYFLQKKSESCKHLKEFIVETLNNPGHKIHYIRSDNAKEFCSEDVENMLKFYGIQHQKSVAYTPQQNGCVEREMRTIVESARTMLVASGHEKKLWAEAINTAVFVINRTGTSRLKGKTPYELWWNKGMYNISNLKIFGAKVGVHIPSQRRLKFDSKADIGYLVGYGESVNMKGYRIYFPHKNNVEVKRDVISIEETENKKETKDNKFLIFETTEEKQNDHKENEYHEENIEQQNDHKENEYHEIFESADENSENIEKEEDNINSEEEILEVEQDRSKRVLKQPSWMNDYIVGAEDDSETSFLTLTGEEPLTFEEIRNRPDKTKWDEAIRKEMKTLEENNTWEEVEDIPDGQEIISSKWVFKIKDSEEIPIYKARLVARGFQQKNCDNQSYAPVAKLTTFRTLMAVATQKRQPVYQMDVTGAFLYGDIDETVYMRLPDDKAELIYRPTSRAVTRLVTYPEAPHHVVRVRVRPSVILRELDRISYKHRPAVGVSAVDDFFRSEATRQFEDETRRIRADTQSLISRARSVVPRSKSVLPLDTVYTYSYGEPIPYRFSNDAYIARLSVPVRSVYDTIRGMSFYSEPAKRFTGRGHLACVHYSGNKGFSSRRPLYKELSIRDDVNLLSFYAKNRLAAAGLAVEKATVTLLPPWRPSRKFQAPQLMDDPSEELKAAKAERQARFLATNTEPSTPAVDLAEIKKRRQEEMRAAEEKALKEEAKREAERKAQAEREAAGKKKAEDDARKAEEAKRQAEEDARKAEEAAKQAEEAKKAEEARKAEEAKQAAEAKKAEEARLAEEAKQAEEARLAEEAKKAEEARLAEEAKLAEEARLAEEERQAEQVRQEELAKLAELEKQAQEEREDELARQAAELAEIARQESELAAARLEELSKSESAAEVAEPEESEAPAEEPEPIVEEPATPEAPEPAEVSEDEVAEPDVTDEE